MKKNDKFLKPGTGNPIPMPVRPGKGNEDPGMVIKPLPVRPGIKPIKPGKPSPMEKMPRLVPDEQLPMPSRKPKIVAAPRMEAIKRMQGNR